MALPSQALDLGRHDEAWLRAVDLPPIVKLVCLVMRFVRFQEPDAGVAMLDRWRGVLRAVHSSPGGQAQFAGVLSYLLEVTDLSPEQLRGVLERATGNGDRIMGTAERLRNEGYARGKAEGKAEGKAQTLIRLVRRRFGPASEQVIARIEGARAAELDQWIDRVLDARSLAELFGE